MKNELWQTEEFEDLVARSLLAMYEEGIKPPQLPKKSKGMIAVPIPHRVATDRDMRLMKETGPFFAPNDRIVIAKNYWHEIDGLPNRACLACKEDRTGFDQFSGYLELHFAERVERFPRGVLFPPMDIVAKYRITSFYAQERGGYDAMACHVVIHRDGRIISQDRLEVEELLASAILQSNADMRHVWNVQAIEGKARATFGVYEEQIKSLFYSRDLPMTVTGRRRPVLHWVSAHRRRIQSGDDVSVSEHLRGITEFEMNGTLFRITNPAKEQPTT